jgi:hypothetical protein
MVPGMSDFKYCKINSPIRLEERSKFLLCCHADEPTPIGIRSILSICYSQEHVLDHHVSVITDLRQHLEIEKIKQNLISNLP